MGCNCRKSTQTWMVVNSANECVLTDPNTGKCLTYATSGQAAREARVAGLVAGEWNLKRL